MPAIDTNIHNLDHVKPGMLWDYIQATGGKVDVGTEQPSSLKLLGMVGIEPTVRSWGDKFREVGLSSQGGRMTTSAILAGLGSGLYGALSNPGGRISGALKWGLGGSLLGFLGGGIHESLLKKQSYYVDPTSSILTSLQQDHSLSFGEKADYLRLVRQLNMEDKSQLSSLLQTFAGGTAGLIISKFLGAKGLLGLGSGALLGAFLGAPKSKPQTNIYGQPSYNPF